MYYNQELGLCIEFGPIKVDSVRRGGAPPPGSNPPSAGSRRHGLLPGLLVIACYLSFTPSSLKSNRPPLKAQTHSFFAKDLRANIDKHPGFARCADVIPCGLCGAAKRIFGQFKWIPKMLSQQRFHSYSMRCFCNHCAQPGNDKLHPVANPNTCVIIV